MPAATSLQNPGATLPQRETRRTGMVALKVRSCWVYRKLRNFRAGTEAGISCLKRS
jgi:hypothetical protein